MFYIRTRCLVAVLLHDNMNGTVKCTLAYVYVYVCPLSLESGQLIIQCLVHMHVLYSSFTVHNVLALQLIRM